MADRSDWLATQLDKREIELAAANKKIRELEQKLKDLEDLVEYAEDEADLGCDHYYDPVVPTSKLKRLI